MRSALACLKSSHWMRQPGQVASTPCDERLDQRVVVRAAQARRRDGRGTAGRRSSGGLSVPTSSETGSVSAGWMPRRRRVQRELADRDGHPAGALVAEAEDPLVVGDDDQPDVVVRALPRGAAGIRSTSAGVIQTPRVRRMMWLNSWHARPTVGV